MEAAVFAVGAVICVVGAAGVILNRNPVHSALCLVATLFGVAVLFIAQEAHFLAAVQVIVYAGAIVVLFLFVIMLLGVDRAEDLEKEPLVGQRPAAVVAGLLLGGVLAGTLAAATVTGLQSAGAAVDEDTPNITQIGRLLFTDYLFAFEITSVLLVIGVVGAVLLARRAGAGTNVDADEEVDEISPPRDSEPVEESA
jgi:NADH-quinone oxidoreductase subunit J